MPLPSYRPKRLGTGTHLSRDATKAAISAAILQHSADLLCPSGHWVSVRWPRVRCAHCAGSRSLASSLKNQTWKKRGDALLISPGAFLTFCRRRLECDSEPYGKSVRPGWRDTTGCSSQVENVRDVRQRHSQRKIYFNLLSSKHFDIFGRTTGTKLYYLEEARFLCASSPIINQSWHRSTILDS